MVGAVLEHWHDQRLRNVGAIMAYRYVLHALKQESCTRKGEPAAVVPPDTEAAHRWNVNDVRMLYTSAGPSVEVVHVPAAPVVSVPAAGPITPQ
jgi:hypothetical protein